MTLWIHYIMCLKFEAIFNKRWARTVNDEVWKDNWFEFSWFESKLLTGRECSTKDIIFRPAVWLRQWTHCKQDLRETVPVLLPALPISLFFSLFQQNSLLPLALWFSPLVQLNIGSRPFSTMFFFFSLPTGGWRRGRISGADRDIFPEQAHAKGSKEPAGWRCCPMSGICARTFSEWGSGGWSSESPLRDRCQHLRWIIRWAVRQNSLGGKNREKRETSFCVDI